MTTQRVTSFTVGRGRAAVWEGSVLAQVDAGYVPTLLHRLEVYKHEFAYDDAASWAIGVDAITRQQEEFLMDIGQRIIQEVRAIRDGDQTSEYDMGEENAYFVSATSLLDLWTLTDSYGQQQQQQLEDVKAKLDEVKEAILAGGGGGDPEAWARLDQIIFLLGAL